MKTELKAVSNQSNQELATLANCAALCSILERR
ncbi:MAG: hypothetical protein RLZZ184_3853 [Cyanobacteriota bacterium]